MQDVSKHSALRCQVREVTCIWKKTKNKETLDKLVSRETLACNARNYKNVEVFLSVKISLICFPQEPKQLDSGIEPDESVGLMYS